MADLIWEGLSISIILLFGINIGLALGLTKLSKKKIITTSISYGLIIFLMITIANFYSTNLYNVFNEYIPAILGIIGLITILSGIYTIKKWKKNKLEYYTFSELAILSSSICFFIGLISVVILLSKSIEAFFIEISGIMTLTIILLIMIFYSFANFLRNAERPYPVVLANFMILNGFYFLITALFLPGIENLTLVQTSALSIDSTSSLVFLIMAGVGIFLVGVYSAKENFSKVKY